MRNPRSTSLCTMFVGLLLITGGACSPGLDPGDAARVFAEAEALRLLYEEGASRDAIAKFEAARDAWAQDDPARAATAALQMGLTHEQLGAFDHALRSYTNALELARRSDDRLLESEVLSNVGIARAWAADGMEALNTAYENCESALALAREASDARQEAKAQTCLGEVAYHRGDYHASLDLQAKSEALWVSAADRRGLAQSLLLSGYAYSDLSDFDPAMVSYERSLAIWQQLEDARWEATTLVAIARLQSRLREYQPALDRFHSARGLFSRMGDMVSEASSLSGIALVYFELGRFRDAERYWEQSLALFEEAGLTFYAADIYRALGQTHLKLGEPERARARLTHALSLSREIDNPGWVAFSLRQLGLAHQMADQHQEALDFFLQSLELTPTGENPRLEVQLLGNIGEAYAALEQPEPALEYLQRGLATTRQYGDRLSESRALYNLALLDRNLGELTRARRLITDALAVAESVRAEVASHDLRTSFLASVHDYYELHIDILMQLDANESSGGFAAEAFQASEQAHARSLLESLSEAGIDLRAGVADDLLTAERELREALDGAYSAQVEMRSASFDDADATALDREILDLEARYRQAQSAIRAQSPEYAALTRPEPLSIDGVQAEVVGPGTVLLEYALGEHRSYLWAVTQDDFEAIALPGRTEIEATAGDIYGLLTARLEHPGESARDYQVRVREAENRFRAAAGDLSAMLLGPVADMIAGKRLLVVADGALQYVPFAALPVPGSSGDPEPLIAHHEIVSLPSASAIAVMRRESAQRATPRRIAAVLADPVYDDFDPRFGAAATAPPASEQATGSLRAALTTPDGIVQLGRLAQTAREVAAIRQFAAGDDLFAATGFDANRDAAMSSELADYRIVHFASHAVFNNDTPGLSGLILSTYDRNGASRDGFVRLHDIYNLDLPAELVVLSACNTALGEQIRGEGLVGIVRGFMYAGSKRVVASLWKVDDIATAELMTRFYEQMLGRGLTPAAALRQAQISMWRDPEYSSPFNWAAFVLQGEWRES